MLCAHSCLLRALDMCACAQSGAGGDDDNRHDDNNGIASIIHQLCTCAQVRALLNLAMLVLRF